MKKSTKKLLVCGLVTAMTLSASLTALAGTWKQDHIGWWWQEDNGSYPVSTWQWIDGNNDGIAECYYFDNLGYCLLNTTTPDGYTVNADGAWTVNGIIQTRSVSPQNADETFLNTQEVHTDFLPWNWPLNDACTAVQEDNRMFWYSNNKVLVNDSYLYGLHVRYYKPDGTLCHPNAGGIGYKPAVQAECFLTRTPFNNDNVGQMEILHNFGRMHYQYNVTNQVYPSLSPAKNGTMLKLSITDTNRVDSYYFYNPATGSLESIDEHTYFYSY